MNKLTRFGRYLKKRKLSMADVARQLDFTRSYVQMLSSGAATPGLHAAGRIKKWSKGYVTFESWL